MDGRGRLAEPLTRSAPRPREPLARGPARAAGFAVLHGDGPGHEAEQPENWTERFAARARNFHRAATAAVSRLPRGAGVAASVLLIAGSAAYGAVKGDHAAAVTEFLQDTRDALANRAGFRIATVSVRGQHHLTDEEILAAAGVTEKRSLLFLDVASARGNLEAMPWIAQASVRKLYPDHLDITLEERDAYAYWQLAGKLSLIASDGTVLGPVGERRIAATLPLVVGPGAGARAHEILDVLERYPPLREQLRAAVLVAERRWNLKLKSGLDIRLPETNIERALDQLAALDRDKKILTRDLTAIDLRLPDRLTVRLSDEAATAREQAAAKDKKAKRKGGDA